MLGGYTEVFRFMYLFCLAIGVVGLLLERIDYATLVLSFTVIGSFFFSIVIPSYFAFLTFLFGVIFLPVFVGIVTVFNIFFPSGKDQYTPRRQGKVQLREEFSRKLFHLLVLLLFLPIGYFHWGFMRVNQFTHVIGIEVKIVENFCNLLLLSMGGAVLPLLLVENLRIRGLVHIPHDLLREKEEKSVGAYTFLISTAFFLSLIFKVFPTVDFSLRAILVTSVIYDSFSAFFGRIAGRTYIRKDRSLEGTLGGLLVMFLPGLYFLSFSQVIVIGVVLCLLDVLRPPIDDNFLFPSAVALILFLWSL